MRLPTVAALALTLACSLAVTACGYRLGSAKPAILQNVTKIAIPTFKNKTFEPQIEVLMADATIKQFQEDGTYEIVPDTRADAILYCTIDTIDRRQARAVLSNTLATREFGLKVAVEYELVDRITGATIIRGSTNVDTLFYTNDDLQTDERQAISTAAHLIAVKLTGRISEGF